MATCLDFLESQPENLVHIWIAIWTLPIVLIFLKANSLYVGPLP